MNNAFAHYVICKWTLLLIFTVFFYKMMVSYVLGIFIWDFSPELNGYSARAISIAHNDFLANNSAFHYYFMIGFAVVWMIGGLAISKILINRIRSQSRRFT
ncbi:hypothetical protein G7017_03910 [Pseudomonas fulva]|uniref:hypothetical protein n=1 Tax=Pseudomonas TaxID=286 RepID=UPI0015E27146|nr:hypothetical protein [Pseudomonas fulva]MBA1220049.1 hypothetical protein [Pseudomonas fulva]